MPKSFRAGKKNGGKRAGAASSNPDRTASAKASASAPNLRSKSTINRLNMYRSKARVARPPADRSAAARTGGALA